jgi:hypothetical protein
VAKQYFYDSQKDNYLKESIVDVSSLITVFIGVVFVGILAIAASLWRSANDRC